LLGPIDLSRWAWGPNSFWCIAGGESGRGARPVHPDWIRSLRDQCAATEVPFFFKQWGEWLPGENDMIDRPCKPAQWQDGETGIHSTVDVDADRGNPEWRHFTEPGQPGAFALRVGKKRAGAMLDGREWREFPT
jgi:protein gp37